ncbi:replication protein A 70 kDa DNA-binding subunit-like [Planococcus citri]|uniref:replication protein A 70 kDa DNA-binding subunit-like n=1 Tax=Planococcus citri TaxID=170843 RepID=UPI0031F76C73
MGMNLNEGCIKDIMLGTKINSPIVQILSIEKVYKWQKAVVSDGVFFTRAMLVESAFMLVCSGELQPYSVVVLDDYTTVKMHHAKGHSMMLMIHRMTILKRGDAIARQIGNPISATTFQFKGLSSFEKSLLEKTKTLSIAELDPGNDCWSIKARIVSKTYIQKSNDEFFNVELADSSGSISATAYNDACRKFIHLLEVDKVYQIRRYYLQSEETTCRKLRLILKHDSEIEPAIENIQFNFSTSRFFNDAPLYTSIDIIGVCLYMSNLINSEDKSRKGLFRFMRLADPSADLIANSNEMSWPVMLSGDAAEKINISSTPVIAIKAAEIVMKSGHRYASVNQVSQVFVNPDIEKAREVAVQHKNRLQGLATLSENDHFVF